MQFNPTPPQSLKPKWWWLDLEPLSQLRVDQSSENLKANDLVWAESRADASEWLAWCFC